MNISCRGDIGIVFPYSLKLFSLLHFSTALMIHAPMRLMVPAYIYIHTYMFISVCFEDNTYYYEGGVGGGVRLDVGDLLHHSLGRTTRPDDGLDCRTFLGIILASESCLGLIGLRACGGPIIGSYGYDVCVCAGVVELDLRLNPSAFWACFFLACKKSIAPCHLQGNAVTQE